jgi:8-oxo-dGTP diphosphatase
VIVRVVAAIIRRNGLVLITRRPNNVHLAGLWEFPGGKVEADESLQTALTREIREELGVEIEVLAERFHIQHDYPTRSVELHFFEARIVTGEPKPLDVADIRWVRPGDLDQFDFPEADRELISLLKAS